MNFRCVPLVSNAYDVDSAPSAPIKTSAAVPLTPDVPRTISIGPNAAASVAIGWLSFISNLTVSVAVLLCPVN